MSDIAIVGMACRFPGADSVQSLWRLLVDGTSSFGRIPGDRWPVADFYDATMQDPDRAYSDVGAFLDEIERFPGAHFGMPPRRVEVMDPQQRLLLEAVRVALEDAHHDEHPIGSNVGVYIGVSASDYRDRVTAKLRSRALASGVFGKGTDADLTELACDVPTVRPFTMPGTLLNMTAATVSQTFDFNGPAMAIDAACASSLAALQQGMTAIRAGQCEAAVVGGVHLNLSPDAMVGFSRIGAVSKSGRCRPFDQDADGFVLGEGVGVVVLKRMTDLAPGEKVYAVIKGVGGSNDGRGAGPMAPRQEGQQLAMARAYTDAGIDPAGVGYIEAHGTGTAVGDVVEINSLRETLGADPELGTCLVSSIKANIGHTMSAAGIAGLIKTALVLKHGVVPPHPSFETPNPKLDLGRFEVPVAAQPLSGRDGTPARAAVSSFGFGGTNVHAVLEAAPQHSEARAVRPELVVLSALKRELLADYADAVREAIAADDTLTVADIADELAGRRLQRHVVAIVATGLDDLSDHLRAAAEELRANDAPVLRIGNAGFVGDREATEPSRVTFLFPGQGAQRVNGLRDLYERFPAFRQTLDRLAASAEAVGESFLGTLYPSGDQDLAQLQQRLADTRICQPALASMTLAQAALLADAGIVPDTALGHSLGEFSAAAAVGVLTDAEVTEFVARRGAVMAGATSGAMLAIRADADTARAQLQGIENVWIANENQPRQVVASGSRAAVEQLRERLEAAGIGSRPLRVSHAFHTPLMAEAAAHLEPVIDSLGLQDPQQRLVSCITGKPYTSESEVRQTWREHATAPVRFADALRAAADQTDVFVQLGPGQALLQMAKAVLGPATPQHFVASASDNADDGRSHLMMAAELLTLGVPVRLRAFVAGTGRHVTLPASPVPTETYPLVGGRLNPATTKTVSVTVRTAEPPSNHVETTANPDIVEIISQVSAFPADTLTPAQTLVGDLGFDSLMFAEAAERVMRQWPAVSKEMLTSCLGPETTVADIAQVVASATGATAELVAIPAAEETPASAVKIEYRVDEFPEYQELRERLSLAEVLDMRNPYFTLHEGVIGDTTTIDGRTAISYSSYNYLGLSGDPVVTAAAKEALDRYGTSVSASRLISGDKPVHRELEAELAGLLGTEDALVLVSGHATNVTVIGHVVGPGDIIVHDALAHDSIMQGCKLSGATRRPFTHNDWAELDRILLATRGQYRRALVVIEGAYSMDGDIPDLPAFIEVAKRHRAMLMVDEAHSLGVLGATGGGIGEHFGVDRGDVDIWMGTLSKSLSSCGGYVGASNALIEYFKYTLPGFIYSCGLPPASAAASLAAIRVMRSQPERLRKLHENAVLFKRLAQQAGLTTGLADGTAVVPVIVGESLPCLQLANALHDRDIHVNPIIYPAVEEGGARLRFFLTSLHSEEQLRHTVAVLAEEFHRITSTEIKAA